MNFSKALVVYKKEMLEMFRDKRTIFSTIILPFILYPLIFIGVSSLMVRQTAKLEEKGAVIALADSVQNQDSQFLIDKLQTIEHFQYIPYSVNADSLYQQKNIHGIIVIRDSLQESGIPVFLVSVQLDQSTDQGKLISAKVNKVLQQAKDEMVKQRLSAYGLTTQIVNTVHLTQKDTSSPQKKLGSLLGAILPYLLIMLLITGASIVAADLVAGEKERKTLETLLVSSTHRNEIVLGKYLTIITFALINVLVNLFSLYFSMRSMVSQSGLEMTGVKFPFQSFLVLFIALIPLATLFAAVLLSISTFSRNMKEARSYEQPVLLVSMLLAIVSFFPAIELNNGLALIPIINISLLFKAVMISDYKIIHLLLTICSTLVLDVFAVILTVKLFNSENVLFRSEVDTGIKQLRKNKRKFFSPYYGLVYYVLALLALYYIGSAWQGKEIVSGMLKTEIILVLLPVLLILAVMKLDVKSTLRLNSTRPLNYLLVLLIAVPASVLVTLVSQLINLVYPIPPEYLEKMSELLKLPQLKLWQIVTLIAILPAICEEIMFRGFIFRFFEKGSKWFPILVSAGLFALFHLDPYRFVPVLLLGILLGWLLYKSDSIYVTMLFHATNNTLAILISQFGTAAWLKNFMLDQDNLQWWLSIPALILLALTLYLFNQNNKKLLTAYSD
ncbi:MAG: ABC transporter permease subunit/CPBP intramembrane protease [Candidatus Cloacimonadaceae bacterium]